MRGSVAVAARSALLAAAAAVALTVPLRGQLPSSSGTTTSVTPAFEYYTFDEADEIGLEALSLLTLPLRVQTRLGPRAVLTLTGAYARGTLERPDGSEQTLSGPTDIELRASTSYFEQRVVVSGIVNLPSGTSTLTADEAFVAGAIAADLLPFRISHWGTGGGLGGSVALAQPIGLFGVGASVTYRTSGDYEPRDGESARYDPGDALQINAVVDRSLGDSKASLRVSYQNFSADVLDEENVFQTGDRVEVMGSLAFPVSRRASGLVYGALLVRENGSFLQAPETTASQDLFLVGTGFELPAAGGTIRPSLRLRVFRTDDGVGEGYSADLGVAGGWRAGGVRVGPTLSFRFGSVDVTESASTGFQGGEIGLSLAFGG